MAVYQVLKLPDETLRTRCAPVAKINDGILRVLDNMRDTLYAEQGLGLAAPQIGILKRLIVIDTGEQYIELINPEIIEREGEIFRSSILRNLIFAYPLSGNQGNIPAKIIGYLSPSNPADRQFSAQHLEFHQLVVL